MKNLFYLLLIPFMAITACDKDPEPEPEPQPKENPFANYELISSQTSGEYVLDFYAEKALFAGYNRVYFNVKKGDETVKDASIVLAPLMDMGMHKHSCPFENPELLANSEGVFAGSITFQMPSMGGTWALDATVKIGTNTELLFSFNLEVANPEFTRVQVITSAIDESKLIIAYNEPAKHLVGNNKLDIVIHSMDDMMTFTPQGDYTLKIEPEMPSMGHGSEGNVDPVYNENGHYLGNVNFSMTGDWRIHLDIEKVGKVVKEGLYFDLFFQ